jgi:hypothetical protein
MTNALLAILGESPSNGPDQSNNHNKKKKRRRPKKKTAAVAEDEEEKPMEVEEEAPEIEYVTETLQIADDSSLQEFQEIFERFQAQAERGLEEEVSIADI